MWILPKQLHTSAFVPVTEALSLDSNESSQLCAQSLFVRSKPSPARIWSLKWKRDSWTQRLYGRILKPFHGQSFVTAWTSSLEVIPASHFPAQASDSEPTTQDTSGPLLQVAFRWYDQNCASSRMWRDTLALASEKSLAIWKASVIKRRGEYSARLNAVRLTSASGFSSWPTCAARDWKGTSPGYLTRSDGKSRVDQLPVAVDQAEAGNWPTPTVQEAGKIGNQANHGQTALSNHPALRGEVTREKFEKGKHGLPAPANLSTHGSRPESWSTPTVTDASAMSPEMRPSRAATGRTTEYLARQIQWATPQSRDAKGAEGRMIRDGKSTDLPSQTEVEQTGAWNRNNGKLNPRWVEILMGVPIGWTMPSCTHPVTIALTNCASLETE